MQNPTYTLSSRGLADRPDDFTGQQVHVIYAVPKDGVDRQLDLTTKIPFSLAAANNWLQSKVGRKVRFDTYHGDLDITFVQLPKTDAEYSLSVDKFSAIQSDSKAIGHFSELKNLLVYYDGPPSAAAACGQSTMPIPPVAGQFSLVFGYAGGCWTNSAPTPTSIANFSDLVALHEMFHAFGAGHIVPTADRASQPNEEICDLMYAFPDCANPMYLDAFGRYYYSPTGFTDGRVNTYDSPFLTPPPPK